MFDGPYLYAGVGTALGAASVLVRNRLAARRRNQQRVRREQLRNQARKMGLEFLGNRFVEELSDLASRYRGQDVDVQLDDVLQGQDEDGRYRFARRRVQRDEHQICVFELRSTTELNGFYAEPQREPPERRRWWPRRGRKRAPDRVQLSWSADPSQLADAATAALAQRLAEEVASGCERAGRRPMAIEVEGPLILFRSLDPLEGPALSAFVHRALELRRSLLGQLRRRRVIQIDQMVDTRLVTAEERDRQKEAEEDTRPLFPTQEERIRREERHRNVTPLLSAEDLLREVPVPPDASGSSGSTRSVGPGGRSRGRSGGWRKLNGKRVFEIPEPEEEVVLIKTR